MKRKCLKAPFDFHFQLDALCFMSRAYFFQNSITIDTDEDLTYDISVALNKIIIYGLQEEPKTLSFYYESDDEITEIYDVIWNSSHKVIFIIIN